MRVLTQTELAAVGGAGSLLNLNLNLNFFLALFSIFKKTTTTNNTTVNNYNTTPPVADVVVG